MQTCRPFGSHLLDIVCVKTRGKQLNHAVFVEHAAFIGFNRRGDSGQGLSQHFSPEVPCVSTLLVFFLGPVQSFDRSTVNSVLSAVQSSTCPP